MPKFKVSVEKRMYATGVVEVEADDSDKACDIVEQQIATGELQTTHVTWGDQTYEDDSFCTTGDVD